MFLFAHINLEHWLPCYSSLQRLAPALGAAADRIPGWPPRFLCPDVHISPASHIIKHEIGTSVKEFYRSEIPNQLTLRWGDYLGGPDLITWALNLGLEVRHRDSHKFRAWGRVEEFSFASLKMEGAVWLWMWEASCCWEQRPGQPTWKQDLILVITKNWILRTTWMSWEGILSLSWHSSPANTWISASWDAEERIQPTVPRLELGAIK